MTRKLGLTLAAIGNGLLEKGLPSENLLTKSLSNVTTLGLTMAITIPLGIVTRIWVPRVLGSKDAGILFFAESFPIFFMNFMTLGAPYYIQKFVPPRPEHGREIFDTISVFGAITATVLAFCLIGFLHSSDYDSLTIHVTAIMIGYQAIQIYSAEFIQKIFFALGHYSATSVTNILAKAITASFVAISLITFGSVVSVATAFTLAQSFNLALLLRLARKNQLLGGGFQPSLLKPIVLVGLPFLFGGTISTVNSSVDTFCLARFANFAELGYYGTSQRVLGLFLMPLPIISQVFGPLLSRLYASQDRAQYSQILTDITRAIVVIMGPLAWGLVLFRSEIISLLYGTEFAPAALSLILQGPMLLLSALSTFFALSAVTTNSGKSFSLTLMAGATINIILDCLLIPLGAHHIGTGGAALGSVLASVLVVAGEMTIFLVISEYKIVNTPLIKIILAGLIPTGLLSATAIFWEGMSLTIRGIFLALMSPGYLFALRLVTAKDIARISLAARSLWENLRLSRFSWLQKSVP
jgi:O-antigen/teichoic acid export membrane protein